MLPPKRAVRPMAALYVATEKAVGQTAERHRSEKFLAFLDRVAGGIKPVTPVHVILYNVVSAQVGRGRPMADGLSGLDVPPRPPE